MSKLVLRLGRDVAVKGIATPAGLQVFSAHDCVALALKLSAPQAVDMWARLMRVHKLPARLRSDACELQESVVEVPILRTTVVCKTPATTLAGLRLIVRILWEMPRVGEWVDPEFRRMVEDAFARFNDGDLSMVEVCGCCSQHNTGVPYL
jgi:hypothetical protein